MTLGRTPEVSALEGAERDSHECFPLPLAQYAVESSSTSVRIRIRNTLNRRSVCATNAAVNVLNSLYNTQPGKTPSFTSEAQQRLINSMYSKIRNFFSSGRRAILDCDSELPGKKVNLQIAWNLYFTLVQTFSDYSDYSDLQTFADRLQLALPKSVLQWPSNPLSFSPLASEPLRKPEISFDFSSSESGCYFGGEKSSRALIQIVAKQVSLPSKLQSINMLDWLPESDRFIYSDRAKLVRADFQLSDLEQFSPPTFGGLQSEYIRLCDRLVQLDMISWTDRPEIVNGLFGIEKDENSIRLIINAQPANCAFLLPPSVQLPSPSHVARLFSLHSDQLFVAKCDLESYYHQIRIPAWLRPFLSLPSLSPAELKQLGIISSVPLYPMCNTLPMGWSHAVYLAHTIHEHILYSYTGGAFTFCPSENILFRKSPVVEEVLHGIIIDDLVMFSDSLEACDKALLVAEAAYDRAGLMIKISKRVKPTREATAVFGHELDSKRKQLSLSSEKAINLIARTLRVLCLHSITGLEISSLIGDWLWTLLLHRPALSLLQSSYRFAAIAGEKEYALWLSVRREFVFLLLILPLVVCRLEAPWFEQLLATDASSKGGAVVASELTQEDFELLWPLTASRHSINYLMKHLTAKQRKSIEDPLERAEIAVLGSLENFPLINKEEQVELVQPSMKYILLTNPGFVPALPLGSASSFVDRGKILQLDNFSGNSHSTIENQLDQWLRVSFTQRHWTTLISTPWKFPQHINALELQAVILALRRVLSSPGGPGTRVLVLSDSAVVTHTILKGRSSKKNLIGGMRKIAALTLASGCSIQCAWIPTEYNPADKPSRVFSRKKS